MCDLIEVKATRVSRAVDVYLYNFPCPFCGEESFSGREFTCHSCDKEAILVFDVSKASWRNIIAIDDEARRKVISKRTVRTLYADQEGKCAYCFKSVGSDYHVDHILPICAGGTNDRDNLAIACPRCNLLASGRVFANIFEKSRYVIEKQNKT